MSDRSTITFVAVLLVLWIGAVLAERRAIRRPDTQERLTGPVIVSYVLALIAVGQALTLLFYAIPATGSVSRSAAAPPFHLYVGGGVLLVLAVLLVIVRQPRRD